MKERLSRSSQQEPGFSLLPPHAAVDGRYSLKSQIYDLLREAIVSLWFKPGEAISEKLIASQVDVSRTPVREAIMKLADEGLLSVFPQSGTIVSPIRLADVYQGQIVRESLELTMVQRATARFNTEFERRFAAIIRRQQTCAEWNDYTGFAAVDEEFHKTISECGGAPGVWQIISTAKAQLDRVRRLGLPGPGQLERLIDEHKAVLHAMLQHDEQGAAQALKVHLDSVIDTIERHIEENAGLFSDERRQASEQPPRR